MFERMEIAESIYESVVTPSYKNATWEEDNGTVIIRKNRGEAALSNTHTAKYGSSGKCRKQYVDFLKIA